MDNSDEIDWVYIEWLTSYELLWLADIERFPEGGGSRGKTVLSKQVFKVFIQYHIFDR